MTWQFLNTGSQNGFLNMRVDQELAQSLVQGADVCTLRVYGWTPWAISLGRNQSLDQIDMKKAAQDGVDVVRRPTGGRAILHAHELTYSVAMLAEGRSVLGVYNDISAALVEGLRVLGIKAVLEKTQPHFPSLYKEATSAACFVSSARHEVTVDGKKLVGSAQRRYVRDDGTEVVLQHGSILLGEDHRRISDYLCISEGNKKNLSRELETRTTHLSCVCGKKMEFEEVAGALRTGFEKAWQIRFEQQHHAPLLISG